MGTVETPPSRLRFWIFLLLVTAALLRLTYALEMGQGFEFHRHEWRQTDMHFFALRANHIAVGDWWSKAVSVPKHSWLVRIQNRNAWKRWLQHRFYQSPGYEYVLAASMAWWGSIWPVKIGQMLLGVLSILLLFHLGQRLFHWRVGLIAGVGALFYGPFVYLEPMLLRTSLLTFLGLLLMALLLKLKQRPSLGWALLFGGVVGVAVLFKATWLLLLGATPIFLWRSAAGASKPAWPTWVGLVVGFAVALSPLVVRNVVVGASPMALSANGPLVFVQGNAPDAKPQPNFASRYFKDIFVKTKGRMLPTVKETLGQHSLWSFLKLHSLRLWSVLRREEAPNNTCFALVQQQSSLLGLLRLSFLFLTPLAFLGWVLLTRGSSEERWALGLCLTFLLLHASSWLWGGYMMRYRVPVAPLFLLGAAFAVHRMLLWTESHSWKPLGLSVLGVLSVALFLHLPSTGKVVEVRIADYLAPMLHSVKATQFEPGCQVAKIAAKQKPATFKPLQTLMCGCWSRQQTCQDQQCLANLWKVCRAGFFREVRKIGKRKSGKRTKK
ncbi:MAG: hypothetical protein EP343_34140 [Deltaproteobacteria bacterium]|nr:MAG: hypothetical protein EP343_34140 [Deltaproteobacteria bacterium]